MHAVHPKNPKQGSSGHLQDTADGLGPADGYRTAVRLLVDWLALIALVVLAISQLPSALSARLCYWLILQRPFAPSSSTSPVQASVLFFVATL